MSHFSHQRSLATELATFYLENTEAQLMLRNHAQLNITRREVKYQVGRHTALLYAEGVLKYQQPQSYSTAIGQRYQTKNF